MTDDNSGHTAGRVRVLIGIGSNTTDGAANVARAAEALRAFAEPVGWSGVYATEPLSGKGAPYSNAVAVVATFLSLDELELRLKRYEKENGRDAEARSRGEVSVDLDLVAYGHTILRPEEFTRPYFIKGLDRLPYDTWPGIGTQSPDIM